MDIRVLCRHYHHPESLQVFLRDQEQRFRPLLKFLSISNLSDLATAFVDQESFGSMYQAICQEIELQIQRSAPFLTHLMERNWTQASPGYEVEGPGT